VFIELIESGTDLTIIPLAWNLDFLAKARPGPKYLAGRIDEVKFEFIGSSI